MVNRNKNNQVIGPRILENYSFLRKIAKSKSDRKRLNALRNANRDELLAIVEVCSNLLSSNFNLTTRQKKKIVPFASYIRKLARIRSESGARKIVVQTGSGIFLPSLLIPVIAEATRYLISSQFDK